MLHLQPADGTVAARVIGLRYHGHEGLDQLRLSHPDEETVLVRIPGDLVLAHGREVWVKATGPAHAWPIEES
jgi:hypothetical protein